MAHQVRQSVTAASGKAGRNPSDRVTLAIVVAVLVLSLGWLVLTIGVFGPNRRSLGPSELEDARKAYIEEQSHTVTAPVAPGSEPSSS